MMIKPLFLSALESTLNSYLALDDNLSEFLAPLSGKIIAVTIQPFAETLYLAPTDDGIVFLDEVLAPADTHLTGTLLGLGLMGVSRKPARWLFSGEVNIEGDLHTGQKFQELFKKLDINLEGKLSRVTGETVAHTLAEFFRNGRDWGQESLETLTLNTREFLQEETRELPAAPEMESFYTQVDDLRMGMDRLQCRIERLETVL